VIRAWLLGGLFVCGISGPCAAQDTAACFSPNALAGRASEKAPVHGAPGSRVAIATTTAAASQPASISGAIRRVDLPDGVKLVALTFDLCEADGEVAGYDGAIVDYLRRAQTKATFFAGGKWLVNHRERAGQLVSDPAFEIGNHTWSHWNLAVASGVKMQNQVNGVEAAYAQISHAIAAICPAWPGADERMQLFRFPYGSCSTESLAYVNRRGYRAIQWDVDSGDPVVGLGGASMARHILARVRPGSIILMHANGRGYHTAEALAIVVPRLRAEGYQFVRVSDLLAAGRPVVVPTCYSEQPGDTEVYDRKWRLLLGKPPRTRPSAAVSPAPTSLDGHGG
jgi:peptidoglycan-N-acetylglucosamine deacetylase